MYTQKEPDYCWKLVLVGDGGCGKTTFVRRHVFGEYAIRYEPTVGCNVHSLDFTTNKGIILFNCWDTAGQEHFGGLRDGYYIGAECAIIMFDLSYRNSYKSVPIWYRDLGRVTEDIPTCIVGNKVDIRDREKEEDPEADEQAVKFKSVIRRYGSQYIEISARRNINYEKPFLYLMRKMLNHANVYFTKEVALIPPDIMPDELTRQEMDRLREIALTKELPIDDLEL